MVSAELLKVTRNRGVVITAAFMTLGLGTLIMVIPQLYRIGHPSLGYVGGQRGLQRGAIAMAFFGSFAAMIAGSSVGTGDVASGVFRDLVATGRSRWSLFAARVPGAALFWVPLITAAFVVTSLLDVWFSAHGTVSGCGQAVITIGPGAPVRGGPIGPDCSFVNGTTPPFSQFVDWYLWVLLYTVFVLLVALGLSSWVGSRAITLGILIPWQLFASPILASITQLAGLRQVLYTQSLSLIAPDFGQGAGIRHILGQPVTSSLITAWVVLIGWIVVMLAAGAIRTANRDA
jgi:ABC-type transport system involved in multi-copper enzyme maturation permease subunit